MPLKVVNSIPASELKGRAIGRALVKLGKLTREDYHEGLSAQKSTHAGKRLGEILVALGKVTELDVKVALAGNYGFDFVDLDDFEIPEDVASALQASTANAYKVVPVSHDPDARSITVAMSWACAPFISKAMTPPFPGAVPIRRRAFIAPSRSCA